MKQKYNLDGGGAAAYEYQIMTQKVFPNGFRTIYNTMIEYVGMVMEVLEEKGLFNYGKIDSSFRLWNNNNIPFGTCFADDKAKNYLKSTKQEDLMQALLLCPYNPEAYKKLLDNNCFNETALMLLKYFEVGNKLAPHLKKAALSGIGKSNWTFVLEAASYVLNKPVSEIRRDAETKYGQYRQEVNEYNKKKEDYEERISSVKNEMETLSFYQFRKKKRLTRDLESLENGLKWLRKPDLG